MLGRHCVLSSRPLSICDDNGVLPIGAFGQIPLEALLSAFSESCFLLVFLPWVTFKLATSLLCFLCARSWGFEGVSTHFPLASYLFAELALSRFPINSGCDRDSPTLHHHFLLVPKVSLHPVLGEMPWSCASFWRDALGGISMMCSGQLVCGLCSKCHLSDGKPQPSCLCSGIFNILPVLSFCRKVLSKPGSPIWFSLPLIWSHIYLDPHREAFFTLYRTAIC